MRRCIQSAQLILDALYKPTGEMVWNENENWQPVSVHTVPLKIDSVIFYPYILIYVSHY